MLRSAAALFLGLSLGVLSAPATPTGTPTEAQIKSLIEQLSSNDFRKREAAAKELEKVGEPALEALKKATKSDDAETARLARRTLNQVETAMARRKILQPTMVELKLTDVPVGEALAELSKQSAIPIFIDMLSKEKYQRKVTIETGRVPFWTALDQLCSVAEIHSTDAAKQSPNENLLIEGGLQRIRVAPVQIQVMPVQAPIQLVPVLKKAMPKEAEKKEPKKEEKEPEPIKAPRAVEKEAPRNEPELVKAPREVIDKEEAARRELEVQRALQLVQARQVQALQLQMQLQARSLETRFAIYRTGVIALADGKSKESPTHVEGPFRFEASSLQSPDDAPNAPVSLLLQVQVEPKVQVVQPLEVRIDRAVDDQGQVLEKYARKADPTAVPPNPRMNPLRQPLPSSVTVYHGLRLPLQLRKGEKESKAIKELTGVATFTVQGGSAEELAEIDDLAKNLGKTATGKEDCSLSVSDVKKLEGGYYRLTVDVGFAPGRLSLPTPVQTPEQRERIQEFQRANPTVKLSPASYGVELQDAEGNAFDSLGTQSLSATARHDWTHTTATMYFAPRGKESGEPSRVVLKGVRPVEVEVPFTLKDIPLGK